MGRQGMTALDRTAEIEAARQASDRTGFFFSSAPSEIFISRLGGLTNLVYRVDTLGKSYVLRMPGKGTEEYINRANEAVAARAAAAAGVSPEVVLFEQDGVMLIDYVHDTRTMSAELFRSVPGAPTRAALAFRQLHTSGVSFANRFDLFGMIDGYLLILASKRMAFPDGYHAVLKEAEGVRAALNAQPLPSVACHCDPLCENFLDTGKRMWIVDWEYSGMNDPLWDLGDLSVEGKFDIVQDEEMMLAYFGREPTAAERGRVVIYKALCDLLWTLWGLIQHANNNPVDDFKTYAETRFARCKALMADPAFAGHVAAVAKG